MKIIRLIPVLCLVVFSACKDPMKNYYGDDKFLPPGGQKVMEILKANPEYSTFVSILEETGMDIEYYVEQEGKKPALMTLWVPLDEDMPAEVLTLTLEEKRMMVRNHLSLGVLNTLSLDSQIEQLGSPVAVNLSGRHMPIQRNNGIYYVDGAELLNTDIACSDGIIQEISEWFLPRVTLYDFIANLSSDSDYSVFRDSLLGRDILTFNKDSSKTEHVDENGKPLWDSIFLRSNDVLDYAKLDDITRTFTVFLPTNEAIAGMYRDMANYLLAANYPITGEDSSRWMDWLMRTAIQPAQREYVPDRVWTNSLWNRDNSNAPKDEDGEPLWEPQSLYTFRTNFQEVYDPTPKKYLNGWSYELNKIRIPKTMYLATTTFNPWRIRTETGGMNVNIDGLDWWGGQYDANVSGPIGGPDDVFIQFGRVGFANTDGQEDAYYGYKSLKTVRTPGDDGNEVITLEELKILPGYYDVGIRFGNRTIDGYANATDSVLVKINGSEFTVSNITTGRWNNESAFQIRGFYITGQYEPANIEVHLFPTSVTDPNEYRAYRRLRVGTTRLVPSDSDLNYQ